MKRVLLVVVVICAGFVGGFVSFRLAAPELAPAADNRQIIYPVVYARMFCVVDEQGRTQITIASTGGRGMFKTAGLLISGPTGRPAIILGAGVKRSRLALFDPDGKVGADICVGNLVSSVSLDRRGDRRLELAADNHRGSWLRLGDIKGHDGLLLAANHGYGYIWANQGKREVASGMKHAQSTVYRMFNHAMNR